MSNPRVYLWKGLYIQMFIYLIELFEKGTGKFPPIFKNFFFKPFKNSQLNGMYRLKKRDPN